MNYRFELVADEPRHWILTPPVTVGRDPTAEIGISDPSISRRHCEFFVDPHGSLVVHDLGSKNGIFVDGRKVQKAVVPPGAEVRIGLVTIRPELTDEESVDEAESDVQTFDLGETQPMEIMRPEGE